MARTTSISGHLFIWQSCVTLTFNLPEQIFQMALLLLTDTNCAKLFEFHAQMYKVWPGWSRTGARTMHARTYTKLNLKQLFYHLTSKCDLDLYTTWTHVSNCTAIRLGEQLCQIILKSMHKCRIMAQTNLDGCTHARRTHHACMHIHWTDIVTTMCLAYLKWARQNLFLYISCGILLSIVFQIASVLHKRVTQVYIYIYLPAIIG